MAQELKISSRLRLLFEAGMDEKGQPIYKTKSYNNIRKEATADDLALAGYALARLCEFPLATIEKTDQFEIV